MLDPLITQEFFQGLVLELRSIVTSYCQDSLVVFPLGLLSKINERGLRIVLGLEEEQPRVSSVIINNDKIIFLPTKTIP